MHNIKALLLYNTWITIYILFPIQPSFSYHPLGHPGASFCYLVFHIETGTYGSFHIWYSQHSQCHSPNHPYPSKPIKITKKKIQKKPLLIKWRTSYKYNLNTNCKANFVKLMQNSREFRWVPTTVKLSWSGSFLRMPSRRSLRWYVDSELYLLHERRMNFNNDL